MNKLKRKWNLITCGILIVLMVFFSFYFNVFYEDAIMFGEYETSQVIKLLLIVKYRGQELSMFLLFFFCLVTLYLFNFIYYYFFIKVESKIDRAEKIIITLFILILLIFVVSVSINVAGFIFISLLLLAGTISYITYLVAKQTIGGKIIVNEEVIGQHGPFDTINELDEYIVYLEKTNSFENIIRNDYRDENKYFVEFRLKEEKNKVGEISNEK